MDLPTNQPILCFILGRGRSGTSLLASMLNANPAISVAPEALFIMNTERKYRRAFWNEQTIHSFCEDVWREKRMTEWGFDQEELLGWLLKYGQDTDFNTVCRLVYEKQAACAGCENPKIVGDKNPHYALFSSQLTTLFPSAKCVHIVRDFRDNILSYRNVSFDCHSIGALAYRWKWYNQCIEEAKQKAPERFITTTYESLIKKPKDQLQSICDFLGVPFSDSMLSFHDSKKEQSQWHQNLSSPLTTSRINRWKENMSQSQTRLSDAICGTMGESYGYQCTQDYKGKFLIRSIRGLCCGWLVYRAEQLIFTLPISMRSLLIRIYRGFTGTHTFSGERKK